MDQSPQNAFSRFIRLFVTALCLLFFLGLGARQAHASCSSTTATTANIHAISVDLPSSPYLSCKVTTTGIVIAVLSDGFYIENASNWDSNTCSSEGIYVYTGATSPASLGIALQQSVTVTGLVEGSNDSKYAGVQIYIASPVVGSSGTIVINSTGNTLPSTVTSSTLTEATSGTCSDYGNDSFGQWLPFEGMRVNIPSSSTLLVTQGTGGTVTASSQTAATNGQFWAVLTTTRPMRSAGISELDPVYDTAIAAKSTIKVWNGNPQLLFVDSTALGGTALDASATTEYTGSSNLIGIVDYHLSAAGYTGLLLTSSSVSALAAETTGATPTAATTRGSDEITFATQDLNSLTAAETNRITKLAYAVVDYLKSPDVLAVQGATTDALGDLISAISSAGGPTYTLTATSTADASSLVNAFLVNASKFDGTPEAAQILSSATYTSTSSSTSSLFDRSPLLLTAAIPRAGISDYVVSLVNTTLLSRSTLSVTSTSADARAQREEQAEALAAYLAPLETAGDHVMVMGGFNSFEFADGYVDALGILDGLEASNTDDGAYVWSYYGSSASSLLDTTTSSPNLKATAAAGSSTVTPATSRYTYVENGSAEQPDHILISSNMSSLLSIDYARFGADFPDSLTYTTSSASTATMVERASTHDGIVAYFTIPYPTTTTVVSSGSPSYYDASVTFTATVVVTGDTTGAAGTPDGTVTFYDGSTKLGTGTLSGGVATYSTSSLTVGTHTITASYGGSETGLGYQASSGTVAQEVDKDVTSLVLASSVNPSYYGEPVTFTATATSSGVTPTGAITFTDTTNSATLCSAVTMSGGVATCTLSSLAIGTHAISASYSGDTTNTTATSNTVSQVVNSNATTVTIATSLTPSYYGEPVTFTATVVGSYGTPTGSIIFYDATTNATLDTQTLSAASGTYTASVSSSAISSLTVGTHTIEAIYAGDGTNAAATGSLSQVVNTNATTVSVVSSENPSYYGDSVTFTATAVGSYGTPTGSVTFYDATNSATLGTGTLSAGTATYTASASKATSTLAVGTHSITATYVSDGTHDAASASLAQVVKANASTLTLAASAASIYYGHSETFTVAASSLSGVPSGSVSILVDGVSTYAATLTTGASASSASLSTTTLTVGTHTITAYYAGDGTHDAATSNAVSVTVLPTYATTQTLSCTPTIAAVGTTISCSDAVTSSYSGSQVSGTITYYDGTTALGTATVTGGAASFSMSSLAAGVHSITAQFAENDPFLSSTSNAQSVTILSSFALSISPTAKTIYTGETATYTLTVTPGTEFALDVALVCSGAPSNSSCTISPATVTGGSGTATITILTSAPHQETTTSRLERGGGLMLAGLLIFLLPKRLRKRASWIAVLLIGVALSTLTACGGAGSLTGGTPAGSYTITVTGTSSIGSVTITETATTTLNVKSLF